MAVSEGSFEPAPASRHRFGVICILSAALFTSTAGILVRLVEQADGWQLLAYRQVSFTVVLFGSVLLLYRSGLGQAFRAIGLPGLVIAVSLASAFTTYVFALIATSVADVVFVVSVSPFVAGLLAWLVLREPIGLRLWLAMIGAFVGLAIMVGGGLGQGAPDTQLTGQLLALASVGGYAIALVAIRSRPKVDMLPAVCLAGALSAPIAIVMAGDLRVTPQDLAVGVTLGVIQLGLQYILLTIGARHVRAAEVALLTRIQAILAPLWVWIGVGEVPAATTLIGGAILLLAVGLHAAWSLGGRGEGRAPL